MTDVLVKPRPGLILAGIPADGAAIPEELAAEWIADQLVVPTDRIATASRRLGRPIPDNRPNPESTAPAEAGRKQKARTARRST